MRIATATLRSASPYSQSRLHETPKNEKETADAYEQRTWREKCTTDNEGNIQIPGMAFKMALDRCAQVLGNQIPGKGKSTYTKFFKAGTMVANNVTILDPRTKQPIRKDDAICEPNWCNADGVRGSGKRVKRYFPVVNEWIGTVQFYILDYTITKDVFSEHLDATGKIVGIGRFRPENAGTKGRFSVEDISWS